MVSLFDMSSVMPYGMMELRIVGGQWVLGEGKKGNLLQRMTTKLFISAFRRNAKALKTKPVLMRLHEGTIVFLSVLPHKEFHGTTYAVYCA